MVPGARALATGGTYNPDERTSVAPLLPNKAQGVRETALGVSTVRST